jgi:vacuolar-type H+-ATPase subunit F/Vma7
VGRLVIVAPPALAPGFRLAGARVRAASSPAEAEAALRALACDPEASVVGVYEPFLAAIDPALRRRLEEAPTPVVISVPEGAAAGAPARRQAPLANLIRRAVGVRMRFGAGGT